MSKNVHFMSEKLDHLTPPSLLEHLYEVFDFDLDPCSDKPHNEGPNVKAKAHFTEVEDGLKQPWVADVVFCNPPYGRQVGKWFSNALFEVIYGNAKTVVCLVAARTDTKWWQYNIKGASFIIFIKGRLKFSGQNSAPFPSALVVFGRITLKQRAHLAKLGWSVFQGDR